MPKSQSKKRPGKRAERKAKHPAAISTSFHPRFIEDADGRQTVIKTLRRKIEELRDDTGSNSVQKELLLRRAAFISTLLETAELNALEGKHFDAGTYTQSVNCLIGLLKCLGLERHIHHAESLKSYVEGKKR